jgi:hypothetical protein
MSIWYCIVCKSGEKWWMHGAPQKRENILDRARYLFARCSPVFMHNYRVLGATSESKLNTMLQMLNATQNTVNVTLQNFVSGYLTDEEVIALEKACFEVDGYVPLVPDVNELEVSDLSIPIVSELEASDLVVPLVPVEDKAMLQDTLAYHRLEFARYLYNSGRITDHPVEPCKVYENTKS